MLIKIGDITSKFGISHRSLRYWEDMGIIVSSRAENDYRYYDKENQRKIQQILILRKLRLPLKQIIIVLESENTAGIIETLQQNLNEVDDEINALSTIRSILSTFITKLNENMMIDIKVNLLDDSSILEIADSLTVARPTLKEDKFFVELDDADKKLTKLADNDVRIIYLPPMTVAASHAKGENCEGKASEVLNQFVRESGVLRIKPDIRHFGFDCSGGQSGVGEASQGYEMWVSIPDDMDVPAPLIKRTFHGGLYAAHMIKMGDFYHWYMLREWVHTNGKYIHDLGSARWTPFEEGMDHGLEEQLNYWTNVQNPDFKGSEMQLDLLFPIKEKVLYEF